MLRRLRRAVALALALAAVDWVVRRDPLGTKARTRWSLGWTFRLGDFRVALAPGNLDRWVWRWDSDGLHGYYGIEYGQPGSDPAFSLIWEP